MKIDVAKRMNAPLSVGEMLRLFAVAAILATPFLVGLWWLL